MTFRGLYDKQIFPYWTGYEYDNKPGAWRERDSSDKGSSFKDRGGFRDDDKDKDRDWGRYGDRGSRERSDIFGPRRNYGDSDWERDRRQDRPSQDAKCKYIIIHLCTINIVG